MSSNKSSPKGFDKVKDKAKHTLDQKEKLKELLGKAKRKGEKKKRKLKAGWENFNLLIRLIKAWKKGEYKKVSKKTILYAVTAILYFVIPLDFIPDFIPISGFIDDISVISFVIKSIMDDLNQFKKWEEKQKAAEDG